MTAGAPAEPGETGADVPIRGGKPYPVFFTSAALGWVGVRFDEQQAGQARGGEALDLVCL